MEFNRRKRKERREARKNEKSLESTGGNEKIENKEATGRDEEYDELAQEIINALIGVVADTENNQRIWRTDLEIMNLLNSAATYTHINRTNMADFKISLARAGLQVSNRRGILYYRLQIEMIPKSDDEQAQ